MGGQTIQGRQRSHARWWRWLVVAALLLATAAVAVALLRSRHATSAGSADVTATVRLATFQVTVTGPGSLAPARTVALAPSVGGNILDIASVGDRVASGQAVAHLDPTQFQRAFDNADLSLQQARASLASLEASQAKQDATLASQIAAGRASLQAAQRTYDSQKAATDLTERLQAMGSASALDVQNAKDALSGALDALNGARTTLSTLLTTQQLQATADQHDLASGRLAVQQAELALATAKQNLEDTTLQAPFEGVVSAVNAAVGEPASAGGPLLTVVDDSRVDLAAQIDESDVAQVSVGQSARVTFDAVSDRAFVGTVTSIAPTATLVSNIPIYYVTVEIANAGRVLRGGMTGQASIVTREIPNTFKVPTKAVRTGGGQSLVLVRQPDGSYGSVEVTVVGASGLDRVLAGDVPDGAVVLVSEGSASTSGASPGAAPSPAPGQGTQRRPSVVPLGGGGFRPPHRRLGRKRS